MIICKEQSRRWYRASFIDESEQRGTTTTEKKRIRENRAMIHLLLLFRSLSLTHDLRQLVVLLLSPTAPYTNSLTFINLYNPRTSGHGWLQIGVYVIK